MSDAKDIVECTSLFGELGPRKRTRDRIFVEAPEYTYLPDGEIREGWLPKVRKGFLEFKKRNQGVNSAAIVGCGPGVDAILMMEIIDPQQLMLTDVDEKISSIAVKNVLENCDLGPNQKVEATHGDLCEDFIRRGLTFDLLYENLPNLPAQPSLQVTKGSLTASFFENSKHEPVPERFASNMLSLHYEFLRQAKACLNPGGNILCCIGARVPVEAILEMFDHLDYTAEVLVHELVRQFEADHVLAEYARIEAKTDKEFRFFDLNRAREAFQTLSADGLEADQLVEQLAKTAPAISAEEAAWRHGLGGSVGHLGLVIHARAK